MGAQTLVSQGEGQRRQVRPRGWSQAAPTTFPSLAQAFCILHHLPSVVSSRHLCSEWDKERTCSSWHLTTAVSGDGRSRGPGIGEVLDSVLLFYPRLPHRSMCPELYKYQPTCPCHRPGGRFSHDHLLHIIGTGTKVSRDGLIRVM